ncbi:bifunctional aminoglycoside phosphotransferase/ATP-binding protein [Rhizobium sp. SL86]|uniref:bifunctional aminoglycoside phosphotransferase/ATP-binding protein n=1 Tax=Rhizobium sp. SL86 TaxID=2995148 RepID=UPI002273E645|nr:bifunctional aminoglycoside phosphotransferase/ATP-binding protein [Rhizobium sp. SL86]MCY1664648.1 AAA family ATPase [Rhizobium sp. SL86]
MIVDEQREVRDFLKQSANLGQNGPVEFIETHISLIALAGSRAFKMKRAVNLPYVDFSTPEKRLEACEAELAMNSVTAPGLYRRVRRITRSADQSLVWDGEGALVDAVVEMVRFDQEQLFDRMAGAGRLTPALMTETARMIARAHRQAPIIAAGDGAGRVGRVLAINRAGFATSDVFSEDEADRLTQNFEQQLSRLADLLDRRADVGRVRRCHGDLHLRNICLLHGVPRLFDCIEFNAELATTDVLYDLAFLLMDLWHRGFPALSNLVMNRYLDEGEDDEGMRLLPFFVALRAAVRAHVTATQVAEADSRSEALIAEARSYFDLAETLLGHMPPRLIAIGGLSGSGKTTVADHLAPQLGLAPGARILESDRVRKALFDVPAETRLPEAAYRPEVSAEVYRELAMRAQDLLANGVSVVADAVFDKEDNRLKMSAAARQAKARFTGIWLEADAATLRRRVREREAGPSDATLDVLAKQLERKPQVSDWQTVAADAPLDKVVRMALEG